MFSIGFTGTHNIQSVDDLAYAVALGIDKGDHYPLKVTFQFTTPSANSESGSGGSAPSVIDSVEANSIDAAINLMNTVVSKEISLSHCKIIVFSEELASQGISKEIYSLRTIKKVTKSKIKQRKIPSYKEMESIKNTQLMNSVKNSIEKDNLEKYVKLVEGAMEEDFDSVDIAAALLKMVKEN